MKWFAVVFSLYLIGMSCIPCTDEVVTMASQSISLPIDCADTLPDFCSPLCVCSCCGVHVTLTSPIVVASRLSFTQDGDLPGYQQPIIDELPCVIWQPPKI
ncbi:MAG: DUF6660 family protein [Bacteroidota bacterium]